MKTTAVSSNGKRRFGAVAVACSLSVAAYAACLLGPGVTIPALGGDAFPGWLLLPLGSVGVFLGYFAWLANPGLWVTWVLLYQKRYGGALKAGLTSLAFGLTFLGHERIPVGSSGSYPFLVAWGYWAWLASIALAAAAAIAGLVRQFRSRRALRGPPLEAGSERGLPGG